MKSCDVKIANTHTHIHQNKKSKARMLINGLKGYFNSLHLMLWKFASLINTGGEIIHQICMIDTFDVLSIILVNNKFDEEIKNWKIKTFDTLQSKKTMFVD
jgi:hypothetical protein